MPETGQVTNQNQIHMGNTVRIWIEPYLGDTYSVLTQTNETDVHYKPDAGETDTSQQWLVMVMPKESEWGRGFMFLNNKHRKYLGANKNGDIGAFTNQPGDQEWFNIGISNDHKLWNLGIATGHDEDGHFEFEPVLNKGETESLITSTGSNRGNVQHWLARVRFTLIHD